MLPKIEFYSADDGRRLAVRVWHAVEPPLARVVFLHGITSHAGWYEQVASHLASVGFDVHFLDRRGAGLNTIDPGDVGDWRTWVEDVAVYLNLLPASRVTRMNNRLFGLAADADGTVEENGCRAPIVLCGISWGGKLVPAVTRIYPRLLDAAALICPGIYSPYLPGVFKRALLKMPVPARAQQFRLKVPLRRAELFTASPRWQQFIAEDPLSLRAITWRFAQEDRRLTDFARKSAPFIHCPILMMLAGQDRIVDNESSRRFFEQLAASAKTLIEYPSAAHTLEFDPNSRIYFADLTHWITRTAQTLVNRRFAMQASPI
jgi:acylglycerol lipase